MKEILKRLENGIVDEGGYTSQDFKSFARLFKSRFGKEIKKAGGVNHVQSTGHYYLSGFFTIGNQPYYYSISDVRYGRVDSILVREVENYKDYRGKKNNYIPIKENCLIENIAYFD